MKRESENMEFTGERFVPSVRGNIELEHLHRYLQACEISAGKMVLDIASGEGYGSAMLADKAGKVIGVDISVDAIKHARKRYKKENLEYMVGSCADIPLSDACVDVVVSFETIEHHDQHEQMMQEIKRVLRPTGILLISSPDKYHYSIEPGYSNPFHLKELYQHEFKQLLERHFKNAAYFGQRIIYGSCVFAESLLTQPSNYWHDNEVIRSASGLIKPVYWIALASDVQLPELASSVFEQPINESEIVKSWSGVVAERDDQIASLNHAVTERDDQIASLSQAVTERDGQIASLSQAVTERDGQIASLSQAVTERDDQIAALYNSRSWRITVGLRAMGRVARRWRATPAGATAWRTTLRARNALRYVERGEWGALWQRLRSVRREAVLERRLHAPATGGRHCGVLATPHTQFVAHALVQALAQAGLQADIVAEAADGDYPLDLYFVLCPQMFACLPPGEKRIAFQMEQSVSSRWFTSAYLRTLENSLAVLDYAQTNLQFLETRGIAYPLTFFVPVGSVVNYRDYLQHSGLQPQGQDAPCDVLFYGDANAPRRQQLLAAIGARYRLRVVGNSFGPELRRAVTSARLVVNLHYYEGALLETTRIHECLSLDVPVVSEVGADQLDHVTLNGAVRFVPVGDVSALLQAVGEVLNASAQERAAMQAARSVAIASSQARFEFMLYRMLLALRWLDYSQFVKLTDAMPLPGTHLTLSLPETTARRAMFVSRQAAGVQVFDGLRYSLGWIGCALSYKYLAQKALTARLPQLEVMEDDVLFGPDHAQRKGSVDAYLARHEGKWDVFVGLIAVMHPQTRVLRVDRQDGVVFVTIDRMMSMVHNIYSSRALGLLAKFDETNTDPETNTVDRYMQSQRQLRVVTTLPFLVGHHEDLHSSLWGISNRQYRDLIAVAQAELQAKVQAFEKGGRES